MSSTDKQADSFWSSDKLVPKRKIKRATDTSCVLVDTDGGVQSSTPRPSSIGISRGNSISEALSRHEQSRRTATVPAVEYSPENSLIKNVKIFAWQSDFSFYEQFYRDAHRLIGVSAKSDAPPCVPFFSYTPQYTQLTRQELDFYFYFRERAWSGEFIKADYSYILLFIFEIINCPDIIKPPRGLAMLCDLWKNYRSDRVKLDRYMSEWVFDYCLVHKLMPPLEKLDDIFKEYISDPDFHKFYLFGDIRQNGNYTSLVLFCISSYNFHRSKYRTNENKEIFDAHIAAAMDELLKTNPHSGLSLPEMRTLRRDAFTGAVCSSEVKRKIEITYESLVGSYTPRAWATAAIKYCENRVRAYLGIKSRLGTEGLDAKSKEILSAYFDLHLPCGKRKSENRISPYEKFYEPQSDTLNIENALEIERVSREAVTILGDICAEKNTRGRASDTIENGIGGDEISNAAAITEHTENSTAHAEHTENSAAHAQHTESENCEEQNAYSKFFAALSEQEKEFIRASLAADRSAEREIAKRLSTLPDVIAEQINNAAAEITGDIILDECDGVYIVVADYRKDISKCR